MCISAALFVVPEGPWSTPLCWRGIGCIFCVSSVSLAGSAGSGSFMVFHVGALLCWYAPRLKGTALSPWVPNSVNRPRVRVGTRGVLPLSLLPYLPSPRFSHSPLEETNALCRVGSVWGNTACFKSCGLFSVNDH